MTRLGAVLAQPGDLEQGKGPTKAEADLDPSTTGKP